MKVSSCLYSTTSFICPLWETIDDDIWGHSNGLLYWSCIPELYLRLDPEIGTGGIIKLVRKVQRELESGNQLFNTGGMPPKLEYELIQREIRRLINCSDISQDTPLRWSNEKQRSCAAMSRAERRPKEFTGELPGDRRRRLCRSKALREQETMSRPVTAPPNMWVFLYMCSQLHLGECILADTFSSAPTSHRIWNSNLAQDN